MEVNGGETGLLVLADGMGGHVGGGMASKLAVRSVIDAYRISDGLVTDKLRDALATANDAIGNEVDAKPALNGMGCTLVAAVISAEGLEWISVGDSPMWLFRDGSMSRLNADHSMAPVFEQLVRVGRMTAEEATTDKKRNALRSALVGEVLSLVDVSSQPVALQPNDIIVLTSDGIDTLSIDEISETLSNVEQQGLEATADEILSLVVAAGKPNQDNTTLLLYRIESEPISTGAPDLETESQTLIIPQNKPETSQTKRSPWPRMAKLTLLLALVLGMAMGLFYVNKTFNASVPQESAAE